MCGFFAAGCANVTCDWYGICRSDEDERDHWLEGDGGGLPRQYRCECPQSCDEMLESKRFKPPTLTSVFAMDAMPSQDDRDYYVDEDEVVGRNEAERSAARRRVFTTTPVCGTDGENYQSECQMRMASCKKQQFVVVANKGKCGKTRASLRRSCTLPPFRKNNAVNYTQKF